MRLITALLEVKRAAVAGLLAIAAIAYVGRPVDAQLPAPVLADANLDVRTAASGLVTPVSVAFIGADDMLVLAKNTGRVQHVVNGAVVGTAIELAVNNASERGLLGIALHPRFLATPFVYL